MNDSTFHKLKSIECHTDRKGKVTYISWAESWGQLCTVFPGATYEVHLGPDGTPLIPCAGGAWVSVSVSVGELTYREWLPVLDGRNNAVKDPNPFDVNRAMKRCLSKAVAMHGLGLYIYRGEDQPLAEDPPANVREMPKAAPAKPPAATRNDVPERRSASEEKGPVSLKALQAMCTACGLRKEDRDMRLAFAQLLIPYGIESYSDLKAPDREIVFKALKKIRNTYADMEDEKEMVRRHACVAFFVGKGERLANNTRFLAMLKDFDTNFWNTVNDEKAA